MPRFPCWSGQSGTRPQLFRVRLLTTSLLRVYGGGFWGGASLRFDSGDLVAQSVERVRVCSFPRIQFVRTISCRAHPSCSSASTTASVLWAFRRGMRWTRKAS